MGGGGWRRVSCGGWSGVRGGVRSRRRLRRRLLGGRRVIATSTSTAGTIGEGP